MSETTAKPTVWTVLYEYEDGNAVSVHATEEGALQAIREDAAARECELQGPFGDGYGTFYCSDDEVDRYRLQSGPLND
jgi:hypothetical protein